MLQFIEYANVELELLRSSLIHYEFNNPDDDEVADIAARLIDKQYIKMRFMIEQLWPDRIPAFDAMFEEFAVMNGDDKFIPLDDESTCYADGDICSTPLGYDDPYLIVALNETLINRGISL